MPNTDTRAAEDVGPYHARTMPNTWFGATSSARRAQGTPPRTPTATRAAEDVGPYHAPHHAEHMVGRDVLGAPRPRDAAEDALGAPRPRRRRRDNP